MHCYMCVISPLISIKEEVLKETAETQAGSGRAVVAEAPRFLRTDAWSLVAVSGPQMGVAGWQGAVSHGRGDMGGEPIAVCTGPSPRRPSHLRFLRAPQSGGTGFPFAEAWKQQPLEGRPRRKSETCLQKRRQRVGKESQRAATGSQEKEVP